MTDETVRVPVSVLQRWEGQAGVPLLGSDLREDVGRWTPHLLSVTGTVIVSNVLSAHEETIVKAVEYNMRRSSMGTIVSEYLRHLRQDIKDKDWEWINLLRLGDSVFHKA